MRAQNLHCGRGEVCVLVASGVQHRIYALRFKTAYLFACSANKINAIKIQKSFDAKIKIIGWIFKSVFLLIFTAVTCSPKMKNNTRASGVAI